MTMVFWRILYRYACSAVQHEARCFGILLPYIGNGLPGSYLDTLVGDLAYRLKSLYLATA